MNAAQQACRVQAVQNALDEHQQKFGVRSLFVTCKCDWQSETYNHRYAEFRKHRAEAVVAALDADPSPTAETDQHPGATS